MGEKVAVAVDVDSSAASTAAVDWAVMRARSSAASIELTTVIPAQSSPHGGTDPESATPYAQALEQYQASITLRTPTTEVWSVVRRGKTAPALIALSRNVDLVVIGCNPTGTVAGIVHGTTPLQVAGRAECPTIVVPAGWTPRGGGIIVGWTDDSTADTATAFAAREALRAGVPLVIVNAWALPVGVDYPAAMLADSMIETMHARVQAVAERVRSDHPGLVVEERFVPGPAAVALVEAAHHGALLVVGSHGRGALGGLILGSVSHDVLMNMPAPVAVVPSPDEPITVLPEILDEDLL